MLPPPGKFKLYRQSGFSLIEVLISMVVLSIGLLGIAGLQVTGLRFAHTANLHYLASQQANDMADRMRANRAGVIAGAYNNIATAGAANPGCITVGCTTTQMAAVDAAEWGTSLSTLLPGGAGTVRGAGINTPYAITVIWTEMAPGGGSIARTYTLNVRI